MNREYYLKNRERILENQKRYRLKNKEKIKEYRDNYRKENEEYFKNYSKEYYIDNKDLIKNRTKRYSIDNKEKIKEYKKEYGIKNKSKINSNKNRYMKERKKKDLIFVIKCNIRTLILNSISRQGYKKSSRVEQILGCSFEEFKIHIESKFKSWMNWGNYGKYNGELNYGWDIDHIVPISLAITEEDVIKLNNFNNLQPLCSKINRDIKINKIDAHFRI